MLGLISRSQDLEIKNLLSWDPEFGIMLRDL